jgi:hypothetical protein
MTDPSYTAEQCAYILAHAYAHDSRPPWDAVKQGLSYGVMCETCGAPIVRQDSDRHLCDVCARERS